LSFLPAKLCDTSKGKISAEKPCDWIKKNMTAWLMFDYGNISSFETKDSRFTFLVLITEGRV
jgi:hypothetical protein